MFSVIGAILAIGVLIVVHEAGHYVVARWCNMRVDRFSLGFGPALLKWRRGETDFTLGPIPFGGFVQINGMTIAEDVDLEDSRAYPNRPVWQRALTIFAGPATNYLFAIALAFGLYSCAGILPTSWVIVDKVMAGQGFDAEGKLQSGDRIISANGEPVYVMYRGAIPAKTLTQHVAEAGETPMRLTVERDGREMVVVVKPKLTPAPDAAKKPVYRLGIELRESAESRVDAGVPTAAGYALRYPIQQTKNIVISLYEVITRKQKGALVGVVGITQMVKRSFDIGWIKVMELLMLLNVYLGLFNLLPLPALDGGRLMFLGYEMVTRRRANPKVEATVHMVGIMALLVLMAVVTYKDIARLIADAI